ncbi:MAG: UDP-N-acetylmuramoyl-tripeptide--D-alanyl-D-alanine ligase [Henriciella sp.]|nr:UDP-N-acetylmuramoyl-tripeptide--D-alanyl-D-alanine ligase [Henriciella sp.]
MSDPLWTSAEIAAPTGGTATDAFDVTGLSIDTRSLQPGDLFVALKDARDGHDFVANAFKAGASGALVSRAVDGGPLVQVDDVLPALEAMGLAARDRAQDCYRVAVTGSVGKTSVKEMLARIFRAFGPAHWNVKSFNNHWGVPLTLARMPRETERAVFEIGMNTPGEIAPRSRMVQPQAAMVTKIAPAHLEGLGSIEGVAREKADIFAGLQPGGVAILPLDDDFAPLLAERAKALQPDCRIMTFGVGPGPDASVIETVSNGETTTCLLSVHGRDVAVTLNAVGDHWALNAAAALLAACPDGAEQVGAAANALDGYTPPPGRGTAETLALPKGGEIVLIDDAYNANPESMRAALAGFAARPCTGRRVVALGEMLEVGATSEAEHAALAEPILAAGADFVFLAGDGMQPLVDKLRERTESKWAVKASELESDLKITLKHGDLLLLKGSNASGMGRLADHLRQWSAAADETMMASGAESAARGNNVV